MVECNNNGKTHMGGVKSSAGFVIICSMLQDAIPCYSAVISALHRKNSIAPICSREQRPYKPWTTCMCVYQFHCCMNKK